MDYIDIVFDGPPNPEGARFVEVEDSRGRSINFGEWVPRPDGHWALRIPANATAVWIVELLAYELQRFHDCEINVCISWLWDGGIGN
jgi:hypothetical protein